MHKKLLIGLLAVVLLTPSRAAKTEETAFHLMMIREVFGGATVAPNAQYVVLQMYAAGQNVVMGQNIIVYDSAGNQIEMFTFPANVANSLNQATILIATSQAVTFFGVTADLTMDTAAIPLRGGKVCFDGIDCVSWGNYTGSSVGTGTPFNQCGGLLPGTAIRRKIVGMLDPSEDTNNSANDFTFVTPAPRNNSNQNGTIPPATCGNGTLEGLEQCDDNNGIDGDGCSSSCQVESSCPNTRGDLNGSGGLSPADVVLMLGCVFVDPTGCDLCYTDVNTDSALSPADVVFELSAVFNGAPFPFCAPPI